MCHSFTGQDSIKRYCIRTLYDALWLRARNIRFDNHKASSPKEHNWAKVITFAEAYSMPGPLKFNLTKRILYNG